MAKFWNSPEFKRLEAEWDERLARSGFVDVEHRLDVPRLFQLSAQLREDYYRILEERLREEEFKDESDRIIMEKTAAGDTIQAISRELKRLALPKNNRDTIRYVRRRYECAWGIRAWKPEDMVSRRKKPIPS